MRNRLLPLALALAALLPASLGAQPRTRPDTVAVLIQVEGRVQVQRPPAAPVPGARWMHLRVGDQVLVPRGARAVVLYRHGRVTLTRTTRIAAPQRGTRPGVVEQTLRTFREVASTDARTQPNRQGMIRPVPGTPAPISPRNGVVVRGGRPRFAWFRQEGTPGYVVQIQRAGAAPARWNAGLDTAWTLPADAPALEPGAEYAWTVASADSMGRAAPPQRFRVATAAELAAVDSAFAALRRAGLDPEGDGLLPAAVVLREAGMLYDALAALDALAASGAPLAGDVHRLRGEVLDRLGRRAEAEAAFAAAEAAGG